MSSAKAIRKNIEAAFKTIEYESSHTLRSNQIKKAMDTITMNAGFQTQFNSLLAQKLWQNTRKKDETVQLKNYVDSISSSWGMLEQALAYELQSQKCQIQEIYKTNDFCDYKTLFLMFCVSKHNSLSNSRAIQRLSMIQQNLNAQIVNKIKGVSEDPAMKLVQMGVNYAGEKKFEQALKCWKEALQIEPKNYLHYSNICRILNVVGRHKQAITYGKDAIKNNQKQAFAHMNLALAYAGCQQFELAQKHSKIGFELNPKNPLCCIDRANILDQIGKTQEADKLYQIAKQLNNSQSRIKFNQDHVNETLQRKFKRLFQYIDNLPGKQNDKKELKQDVQGLKKDMMESKFIIDAFDKLIKKQERQEQKKEKREEMQVVQHELLKEMKQKYNRMQQELAIISNEANQSGQRHGGLVDVAKGHTVQIQKIDKHVKRLREQMKVCLKDIKEMPKLMEKFEALQKKISQAPVLDKKKGSGPQSERLTAHDLQSINNQLIDIIDENPESLLRITVKIESNLTDINPSSVIGFCKQLKKLKSLEQIHLNMKQIQQNFLSKLKENLPDIASLKTLKITLEKGDETMIKNFKQEITLKKASISCQITIKN